MTAVLLANYEWNIFLRGILFPLIMFTILCGSSYLLLATNVGNRLGFLIAATGLVGWMFLMSITWMLYGIGLKGEAPAWVVKEVITDQAKLEYAQFEPVGLLKAAKFDEKWCPTEKDVTIKDEVKAAQALKKLEAAAKTARKTYKKTNGWEPLCVGTSQRGDGQSTVDATVVKSKTDPSSTPRAVFSEVTEYRSVGAFRRGGDNQLFTIGRHPFFLRHSPHYFVIVVQPVQEKTIQEIVYAPGRVQALDDQGKPKFQDVVQVVKDAKGVPVLDTAKPATSVVMLRDQGSKRLPPFILFMFSGIALAILASVLHQRDKQVMSAMGKPYKGAKQLALKK